jgi:hypothetical protein
VQCNNRKTCRFWIDDFLFQWWQSLVNYLKRKNLFDDSDWHKFGEIWRSKHVNVHVVRLMIQCNAISTTGNSYLPDSAKNKLRNKLTKRTKMQNPWHGWQATLGENLNSLFLSSRRQSRFYWCSYIGFIFIYTSKAMENSKVLDISDLLISRRFYFSYRSRLVWLETV